MRLLLMSFLWLIALVFVCRTSQDLSTGAVAEDTIVEEDSSSPSKDAGGDTKARLM